MKLTYWVSECIDDSSAYNMRATTKKELVEHFENQGYTPRTAKQRKEMIGYDDGARHILQGHSYTSKYGEIHKVTVEYSSGFDLMEQCLGEGRGYWEAI